MIIIIAYSKEFGKILGVSSERKLLDLIGALSLIGGGILGRLLGGKVVSWIFEKLRLPGHLAT